MRIKSKWLVLFVVCLFCQDAFSQDWKIAFKQGYESWSNGKFDQAFSKFDYALEQVPKASKEYFNTLRDITELYAGASMFEKAEANFRELLAYAKADTVMDTSLIMDIAIFYHNSGKLSEAEIIYQELERILDQDPSNKQVPNMNYIQLMEEFYTLYANQGLYKKAEQKLLPIIRRLDSYHEGSQSSPAYYSGLVLSLGSLYLRQNSFHEAEDLLLKTYIKIEKENDKNNFFWLLRYYEELAIVYEGLHQPEKALEFLNKLVKQSKTEFKKSPIVGFEGYAWANFKKGAFLMHTDRKKGISLLTESIKIFREGLSRIHADYQLDFAQTFSSLLLEVGKIFKSNNEMGLALSLIQEADSIATAKWGTINNGVVLFHNELAKVYHQTGERDKAINLYQEASKVLLRNVNLNFSSLSERERQEFYQKNIVNNFNHYYAFGLSVLPNRPDIAGWLYNNRLGTKGILFQSTEKVRKRVMASKDKSLIAIYDLWRLKKNMLANVYQSNGTEMPTISMDSLEMEINDLERQLSQNAQLATVDLESSAVDWKQVQAKLKPGMAAVELVRFTKERGVNDSIFYAAFCIRDGVKQPEILLLKNGVDLEARYLYYFRNAVKNKLQDNISYKQFWKPFADYFKRNNIQEVYFSGDGVFNMISLECLYNPETNTYVFDEIKINLLTSTRALLEEEVLGESRHVCLMGYPAYKGNSSTLDTLKNFKVNSNLVQEILIDSTQRFFSGDVIVDLPGTKKEVNEIANLLHENAWAVKKYLEAEATEEALKALVNPQILHVATHGYFIADTQSRKQSQFSTVENPLLRSGLLLANCQNSFAGERLAGTEDGILTAYEAMNLNLDKTNLVVLSACETGLGEVRNGEGVYGLQRAFQQAGAKEVLMSLWTVSDEATQLLMIEFYRNLLNDNVSTSQALFQAKNEVRKKYPEPYYWGAFVLLN